MSEYDEQDQAYADLRIAVEGLEHKLMLAESALGEVRAYLNGSGHDLDEIIEHYRTVEGVAMPNDFDDEEEE